MDFNISRKEKNILLVQAREVISAELEGRKPVFSSSIPADSNLYEHCGAFVSLHMVNGKNRSLRGCIGNLTDNLPLIETVRIVAKEAAFGDPRFLPLKKYELTDCRIEISVLSPMIFCQNPMHVKVGVHGLYIKKGFKSGVFLPQVPVEQGWNINQYLENLCVKAGLSPLAYKALDTEIHTFTAIVFAEE